MTQIQVRVSIGTVSQSLSKLGESVPRLVNADIESVMNQAREEVSRPGDHISYPVRWDSDRQRRAYFATKGFGAGIPYPRTGRYERGWKVDQTGYQTNRAFTLSNNWSGSKYVGGNAWAIGQSRIHLGRWSLVARVVTKYAVLLVNSAASAVHRAISESGMGT